MIGFWNYTMILTYMSLLSAVSGIIVSLHDTGHPYMGMFFLLICGLCDTFDGRVARTKKDRTPLEKEFGVQVDSLSDLVAFGVLPVCIGYAMLKVSSKYSAVPYVSDVTGKYQWYPFVLAIIALFYVLAAMVRLAYFNATEEERAKTVVNGRPLYTGLPVTSAALIFPLILVLDYGMRFEFSIVYFTVMAVVAFLFLGKFQFRKPTMKGVLFMIGIGAVEFIMLLIIYIMHRNKGH